MSDMPEQPEWRSQMNDIVYRLRHAVVTEPTMPSEGYPTNLGGQAADRIEALEARMNSQIVTNEALQQALYKSDVRRDRYKAALKTIARPIDCGCNPCRGQCREGAALVIELDARMDIASEALEQPE